MPAFFFISGYLLKNSKLELSFKSYLALQTKSLVFPYIFYSIVSTFYSIVNSTVKKIEIDMYSIIYGYLYGNAEGLTNIVLWFLTCIFSTSIIFYLLYAIYKTKYIVLISFILSLTVCYFHRYISIRPPWNLDLSLIALFFFASGKFISDLNLPPNYFKINKIKFFILTIALCLLYFLTVLNGKVDMAFMSFRNPIIFLVNSFIGIFILLIIGASLPITSMSRFLSKNTLVIFPMHPIFFSIFTGAGIIIFKFPQNFQANFIWTFVYTIGALLFSYPISILLFKFFPILIGGRKGIKIHSS